jgi:hypothetical protein
LDATGLSKRHIVVITDGENTAGYAPQDVTRAIVNQTDNDRSSIYFVAFDVAASKFNAVKDAGGLVLAASNETGLRETLDYLLPENTRRAARAPLSKEPSFWDESSIGRSQ